MAIKIGNLEIRPEITEPIYYLHVVIIAVILLAFLKFVAGVDLFNWTMILWVSVGLTFGDITAHTLLKFD